jgi:hypothetical protein
MDRFAMGIVGMLCVMTSLVSVYKLAPREGKPTVRWVKVESVEIMVTVVLVTLLALGISFLFAAFV